MLRRFFFLHTLQVRSNICPICQQASECPMQRTMLAAVQATAERLIAPRHLMGQMFEQLGRYVETRPSMTE